MAFKIIFLFLCDVLLFIFIIMSETCEVSYQMCIEGFYPEEREAGFVADQAL